MSGSVSERPKARATVDAHRLGKRQGQRIEGNIRESFYSEMYTLLMRMVGSPRSRSAFATSRSPEAWMERGWALITLHSRGDGRSRARSTTETASCRGSTNSRSVRRRWRASWRVGGARRPPDRRRRAENETITMNDVRYAIVRASTC